MIIKQKKTIYFKPSGEKYFFGEICHKKMLKKICHKKWKLLHESGCLKKLLKSKQETWASRFITNSGRY